MSTRERPLVRVEVNHDLCVGVGMCSQFAPAAFKLNAAGQAEFHPESEWTVDALREAADACPMSAITVVESDIA